MANSFHGVNHRRLYKISFLVFFVCLFLTFVAVFIAQSRNALLVNNAMNAYSLDLSNNIHEAVRRYVYGLRGARGAIVSAGVDQITDRQFKRYFLTRSLSEEFPGAMGIGFIRRVPIDHESEFIAQMRKDIKPDFSIREINKNIGDRYIIQFIEPLTPNLAALGLDINSEENRKLAADESARTGEPILSAPITLVQAMGKSKQSFLFLMPIYEGSHTPEREIDRKNLIRGWSYSPLSMSDVLAAVGFDSKEISIRIADVTNPNKPIDFFSADPLSAVSDTPLAMRESNIHIYGRVWRVNVSAYPQFFSEINFIALPWVFFIGVVASLMVSIVTWLFLNNRARHHELAAARNQLALIVDGSIDGIIGKSLAGEVTSWNKGAEYLFGYTSEEAIGRYVVDLIVPIDRYGEEQDILARIASNETLPPFETIRHRKDGSPVVVSVAVAPIKTADGKIIGASKTVRDITLQKQAEEVLASARLQLEIEVVARTEELEKARHTLRTVLDALPSMIGYWDRHLINRVANKAYESWFAVEAGGVPGKSMIELLGQEQFESCLPHVEQVMRGVPQTFERELYGPHGVKYVLAHYLPDVFDGEVQGFFVIVHDVTELSESRERLSKALQENQALLQTINAQFLYSSADLTGKIIDVNDNFCRVHGYDHLELLCKDHRILRSGEHSDAFYREMWLTLSGGHSWRGEICNLTKNGEKRWFDTVIAPVIDSRGEIERYIALRTDTTERRAAIAEANRLNILLSNILHAASEISIITTDVDGLITVFNQGAERMLGYSALDVVGKQTPAIIHLPSEVIARGEELSAQFGVAIEGFSVFVHAPLIEGAEIREWTYVRQDGQQLSVSLAVTAMRDSQGQVTGYLGVAVDVTESRRQQQELSAARDQLLLAAEVAHLGVWSWSIADDSLSWNAQMFAIYDQPESLSGNGLNYSHWRSRVHPDDVDEMEQLLLNAVVGSEEYDPIFRVVRTDGSIRYVHAGAYIERDEAGAAVRVIGINLDITQSKQFEETLLQAKALAEQASVAKGQFLANMSHEIRTPLNATLGMLQLLQQTKLSDRQADYANKAKSAATSLLGLLNDLLDFSKIEAGKLTLDAHPFELDALMRDLAVVLSGNVGQKNVEILFDIDSSLPLVVSGDRLRLQQILINLAGNAVKFTSEGQVIVSLRCIESNGRSVRLQISVSDTGIGIAPELQERIFEGFLQAEASTTRRFGGTGLGLAISRRLVEVMGGQLHLESTQGKGSRFWFDIDIDVVDIACVNASDVVEQMGHIPHILAVDDNDAALVTISELIKNLGWRVTLATSGPEALDRFAALTEVGDDPDIVLMDWRMPGMSGLDAARALQDVEPHIKKPAVIMCTAFGREVLCDVAEQPEKPFVSVLAKPFTPIQFLLSVRSCLGLLDTAMPIDVSDVPADKLLHGVHLLVVEDNAFNRQVAAELLGSVGATVSLAEGGLQGVALATAENACYDLIVMDMQMPDIDGLEATRRIRADPRSSHVPIVAMTANASSSDKELCLAAGMNAHVSKPINLSSIIPVLLHALGRVASEKTHHPTPIVLATQGASTDSWKQILSRFGGNVKTYDVALKAFAPEALNLFSELETACSLGEQEAAYAKLHTLKGVAATVGAAEVASIAAALEVKSKINVATIQEDDLSRLKNAITRSVTVLNDLFLAECGSEFKLAAQAQKPAFKDIHAWLASVHALVDMLRDSNMQAIDEMNVLSSTAPPELQDLASELSTLIESLRFSEAVTFIHLKLSQESHDRYPKDAG